MPTYEIDGHTVNRKNLYMPCIVNKRFDDLPPEEQVRLLKATYWADNIANAEWPVVLRKPEATAPNRSRLKRKAAGWIVALGRIAALNPDLFDAIVKQARTTYVEQVEQEFPWSRFVLGLTGLIDRYEPGEHIEVRLLRDDDDD